jgi:hypothetical protein
MFQKKYLCFLFFLVMVSTSCYSQEKPSEKPLMFHSINQVGLLDGSTGTYFQMQSVNGFQYKKWFAGIGAGLDYYRYRSFPLFADVRRQFGNPNKSFFIYADAGVHFIWVRTQDKKAYYFNADDQFINGFYCDAGLGYQLKLKTGSALLFSAGFSYKKVTEKLTNLQNFTNLIPAPNTDWYDYYLNRLTLKIGFQL